MEIDKVKWDRVGLTINSSLPVGGPPAIVFFFFLLVCFGGNN